MPTISKIKHGVVFSRRSMNCNLASCIFSEAVRVESSEASVLAVFKLLCRWNEFVDLFNYLPTPDIVADVRYDAVARC